MSENMNKINQKNNKENKKETRPKYTLFVPKLKKPQFNTYLFLIASGTFFLLVITVEYWSYVPNLEVNPFLFIGIVLVPITVTGYFMKTLVQSLSIHIFAPDGYFWSVYWLNKKTVQVPIIDEQGKQSVIDFLIIPLGGGLVENFFPFYGGGHDGFLVVNKTLLRDYGGNIAVFGDIKQGTVYDLIPSLRVQVLKHPRFRGNPEKVRVYFSALSTRLRDNDLNLMSKQSEKVKTVGDLWQLYSAKVRYARHLESRLATSESLERVLDDYMNKNINMKQQSNENRYDNNQQRIENK